MKMISLGAVVCALALGTCVAAEERTVSKQVTVKAPLDAVWSAWTTTEGVKSFFAPDARVEARPDGPFEIYMNPYAQPGMKGADDMRVLAVQERKMISYTWNAPPAMARRRSPGRTSAGATAASGTRRMPTSTRRGIRCSATCRSVS